MRRTTKPPGIIPMLAEWRDTCAIEIAIALATGNDDKIAKIMADSKVFFRLGTHALSHPEISADDHDSILRLEDEIHELLRQCTA